jgi:hypothetical protein
MNSGRIRVIAVEPESAATLATALRDGPETEIHPGGVAANSLGAPRIGRLAPSDCCGPAPASWPNPAARRRWRP